MFLDSEGLPKGRCGKAIFNRLLLLTNAPLPSVLPEIGAGFLYGEAVLTCIKAATRYRY